MSNLTNGTSYNFTVRAANLVGSGQPSSTISATPQEVPAPTNFRVTNATVVNGVYEADSQDVELDWDMPSDGVGNHLTKYWTRPGNTCPEGQDGGNNQEPVNGPCPVLTLYTEYGTGNTGSTSAHPD